MGYVRQLGTENYSLKQTAKVRTGAHLGASPPTRWPLAAHAPAAATSAAPPRPRRPAPPAPRRSAPRHHAPPVPRAVNLARPRQVKLRYPDLSNHRDVVLPTPCRDILQRADLLSASQPPYTRVALLLPGVGHSSCVTAAQGIEMS